MTENRKLARLQEKRDGLSARLFLVRCCIAFLPIAVFHLIEQRSISGKEIALYGIGIPVLLWLYDRFFCRRR